MTLMAFYCPTCGDPLRPHCFVANACTWLRCGNEDCTVAVVDLEHGVTVDRAGKRSECA